MNDFDIQDLEQADLEKIPISDEEMSHRSKLYCGILYPDDESQQFALKCLLENKYNSIAMVHDGCYFDNGEKKKTHVHFVIRLANGKSRSALSNELKVKPNYIQSCSSFNSYCCYMTHQDFPFKTQYLPELAYGSLYNAFLKAIQKPDDESVKVLKILEHINNSDVRTPFRKHLKWVCDNGLYDVYRRSYSIFRDIINQRDGNL